MEFNKIGPSNSLFADGNKPAPDKMLTSVPQLHNHIFEEHNIEFGKCIQV